MKIPNWMAMSPYKGFEENVSAKLKELLENKHLYQKVSLDVEAYEKHLNDSPPVRLMLEKGEEKKNLLRKEAVFYLNREWRFDLFEPPQNSLINSLPVDRSNGPLIISAPTVTIPCSHCNNTKWPHNSGFRGISEDPPNFILKKGQPEIKDIPLVEMARTVQVFSLPFQCQHCKGEPVFFLLRREGLEVRLVGRSQFEKPEIPNFLPVERKYFREAVISYNSGRTLAAIFFLRTFVEQYFRRVVKAEGKLRGEDLGKRYSNLLDPEFPKKFDTLGRVYEELSAKMHAAQDDDEQYKKSIRDITEHFDQLRMIPLPSI